MNKMHNLGTVIRFEVVRMLKKPSFWLMALGFPLIIAVVFGIVFFSNQATMEAAEKLTEQKFSLAVTDESSIIKPELLQALGAKIAPSRDSGVDMVKSGQVDAYFYYPPSLSDSKVEVYGKDVGMFDNSRYSAVANMLLSESVNSQVNPEQRAVLQGAVQVDATMYRDGIEYEGFKEMIIPGLFLVLFYLLIGFFGGQMLNSTVEEKENRTIEMLLTTINARALIAGKILSLIILALIQIGLILIPVVLIYLLAGPQLQIPSVDLSNIPFDPLRVGLGAAIFAFSFLLFTGLLVAVGAAMPTAKEASQWFGIVVIFIFGPLYGVTAFITYPDSPFVRFLSLFPLTSPIPLMLRNAYGNLPIEEALLGIAILAVSAVLMLLLAVRIFQHGAMQYDSKLSLKALRAKRNS
ncbi:hypothetical protein B7Y94_05430 [Candidatus Saccharibacteria bacterium 32-49-12]|nr:MAG: hypothetical protein B7Y94_05430 [Candidatus Saccharibacteria bacterium 32-49-12]